MEQLPNRFSTSRQLYLQRVSDTKSGVWHILNQPVIRPEEVICPEPRRPIRVPYAMDSLNRICCKPKGFLQQKGDSGFETLDIILSKGNAEEDSDTTNHMGFFCGSPPVRTSNPVIHDAQFAKQTSSVASPLGNSHGGKPSARLERGAPSCGSSFGGKPKVRIEGFASGNSEPRCIIPALA